MSKVGIRKRTLTSKQSGFARAVASGQSLSDAYRQNYKAERMRPATIRNEASLLMANPDVTMMVERLMREKERAVVAQEVNDRDLVLNTLREMIKDGKGTPDENTKLRAADLLGKSIGIYKDVQVTEDVTSAADIKKELEEMLDGMDTMDTTH